MSERRTIAHKKIFWATLILSLSALPFSVKLCHCGMILLLANWSCEGQWSQKFHIIRHSLFLQVLFAAFLIQLFALSYTARVDAGWFSLEKKIFFYLIPLALATTAIRLDKNEIKTVLYCFVLSCFAGTVACLLHSWDQANQYTSGAAPLNQYLSTSSYGDLHPLASDKWLIFSYVSLGEGIRIHPTFFSLYLSFCVIFTLHEISEARSRVSHCVLGFLSFYFTLFIIFLASRIIIIALAFIFAFALVRLLVIKRTTLGAMAFLIVPYFCLILYSNPVSRYRNFEEINLSTFKIQPGMRYQTAAQIRVSLWWTGFKSLGKSDVILGSGTGDVEFEMKRTSTEFNVTNILNSFDPHNQYLYTLIGNGIVGLVLLLCWMGVAIYFAWIKKNLLFLGYLFLMALLCLTETALELQKGIVFSALIYSVFAFQWHSFQSISITSKTMVRAGR